MEPAFVGHCFTILHTKMDTGNYMANQMDDMISNGLKQYDEICDELEKLKIELAEIKDSLSDIDCYITSKDYVQIQEEKEKVVLGKINQLRWVLNLPSINGVTD